MDSINIKQKIGEKGTNHSPDTLHRQTDGQGETNIHLYDTPIPPKQICNAFDDL